MMKPQEEFHFSRLIIKCLEGSITDEELARFNQILLEDPSAYRIYAEIMFINSRISLPGNVGTNDVKTDANFNHHEFDPELWNALVDEENSAPALEIPKPATPKEPIRKLVSQSPQKINKVSLFTAILSAAALLFMIVFVNTFPHLEKQEVARISREVDAEWLSDSGQIGVGSYLYPGPLILKKGLAEITMENGARVLLEAPVQISLETSSWIYLEKGRLVANIEKSTDHTFVVRTATSTVVDLGTEYGVEVDEKGQTNTHVFKGKVELRQGPNPLKYHTKLRLAAGQSGQAKPSGELVSIADNSHQFTSVMPSAYEYAVLKTKPLYYWRFDRDQGGLIRNEMSPELNDEYKLYGSLGYSDGPNLGSGHNVALQCTGRNEDYAILRHYNEQTDEADGFTVAMWIRPEKPDSVFDRNIIFRFLNNVSEGLGRRYIFGFNSENRFYFRLGNEIENGQSEEVFGKTEIKSNPVPINTWHHVVVSYSNGNRMRLYVNGHLEAAEHLPSSVRPPSPTARWCIGSGISGGPLHKPFIGSIDEISHYNRELSTEDVQMLYAAAISK